MTSTFDCQVKAVEKSVSKVKGAVKSLKEEAKVEDPVPTAISKCDGTFTIKEKVVDNFPIYAESFAWRMFDRMAHENLGQPRQ